MPQPDRKSQQVESSESEDSVNSRLALHCQGPGIHLDGTGLGKARASNLSTVHWQLWLKNREQTGYVLLNLGKIAKFCKRNLD